MSEFITGCVTTTYSKKAREFYMAEFEREWEWKK
jgi:hypothetical protein